MIRTKGRTPAPHELWAGRWIIGALYVLIFCFFVYLDAYVASHTPMQQALVDEIRADFLEQLK